MINWRPTWLRRLVVALIALPVVLAMAFGGLLAWSRPWRGARAGIGLLQAVWRGAGSTSRYAHPRRS
jgi:hypothetical protein